MKISKALNLKRRDYVTTPDGPGRVTHDCEGSTVQTNFEGVEFIWVEVKGPHHKSVWPSNRL